MKTAHIDFVEVPFTKRKKSNGAVYEMIFLFCFTKWIELHYLKIHEKAPHIQCL